MARRMREKTTRAGVSAEPNASSARSAIAATAYHPNGRAASGRSMRRSQPASREGPANAAHARAPSPKIRTRKAPSRSTSVRMLQAASAASRVSAVGFRESMIASPA